MKSHTGSRLLSEPAAGFHSDCLLFVLTVFSLPAASLLLADGFRGLLREIGQDVVLELGLDLSAAPDRHKDRHHVFTDSRAVHPSNTL